MDGMETTQEIRKLGPQYENLPIVALTANAVAGMREMFLSNGFNDFISKPIVMQELDNILKKWLAPEKVTPILGTARAVSEMVDSDDVLFIEAVKKIEEINAEVGLSRFSCMNDMYRSTLDMFYRKVITECNNMTIFLEAKDLESFTIAIHAMKSSLATIGAMRLSETAFELETASKNDDFDHCAQKFPEFNASLLSLHEKLSVLFPVSQTAREKKPGDAVNLQENIQKALSAVEEFDNDTAMGIIMNLLLFDFGEKNNILLEDARSALENFEHEGAVEILKKVETT